MSRGDDLEPLGERAPGRRVPPALVGGGVLGAALAAFVAQNTEQTTVSWLFFDTEQPLWLVLLVTVAAALVLGELLAAGLRRRRARAGRER